MATSRRLGVFIDGGFHDYIYQELANTPPKRRLSLFGLVESVERYFSGSVVERHYVRGTHGGISYRGPLLADLDANDFHIHTTPNTSGKEVGADVTLSLLTYIKSREERLSAVALFAGDGDLFPLVDALKRLGVACLVPSIHLAEQKTSGFLLKAADHTPTLSDMAEDADRTPGAHAVLTRETHEQGASTLNGINNQGVIKFVDAQHRFAFIEDIDGQVWYMSPKTVPGEPREAPMSVGVGVSFSGAPQPAPGQKYPRAWSIRAAG